MRIGYSYWGFLGDNKLDEGGEEISAPDGNATYSWSIIWEAQRRGHTVYRMQRDRDWPAYKKFGDANFASFSTEKRGDAYRGMVETFGQNFPELDVLLLEWRFPIPGRNCSAVADDGTFWFDDKYGNLQQDLVRQDALIKHYIQRNTKIIFWDLDHKLTFQDEKRWNPDAVFETSYSPRELFVKRTRVEPPFHIPDLLQHPTLPSDSHRKLAYIGSRYERDDVIEEWIKPVSEKFPGQVEFHGNWSKTLDEVKKLWPNISYHDRCTTRDFRKIYGTACAVPLLAKRSYLETGFITPRPWEALLFGSIPVGLATHKGIEDYCTDGFIAVNPEDMIDVARWSSKLSLRQRDVLRKKNVEKLEFMDASHFVDALEKVA